MWRALDRVVTQREEVDSAAAPPPSADRMIWTAVATVVLFMAALMAGLELLSVSRSWWLWAAGSLTLSAIGLWVRRWRPVRSPATGALAGLAMTAAIVAITAVVALLQ